MATSRVPSSIPKCIKSTAIPRRISNRCFASVAEASTRTQSHEDVNDLEQSSAFDKTLEHDTTSFDPARLARERTHALPSSRYKFRPPKYYRGPLHPHQPPRPSDPSSREFQPGPFTLPRLAQTYESTVAPDFMILAYHHFPPGYEAPTKAPRLRNWDDSSPYHAGRGLRKPRGGDNLRLLRKPITFRNIPRLESITVHSFIKEATKDDAALSIAGMALQAITGVRCEAHTAKQNIANWGLREGKYVSVTSKMTGEYMHHFMGKIVDVVLPKIKEYKGVSGGSGDTSGNISFGLTPEEMGYFPEIEMNYDSYPPKMIPGCHITIKTTAKDDRDARLLLTALGIPFYGRQIN